MRDPLNYDPAPYTDAAITISPTPAWKWSVNRHVPEHLFTDNPDVSYPMPIWAASVTCCSTRWAQQPYDYLIAHVVREQESQDRKATAKERRERLRMMEKVARAALAADMKQKEIDDRGFTW